MGESLSRTFARYVSSLDFDALPAEVVDKIKASLLHALIIGIVGAGTSHGKAAIALAKKEESKEDGATILVDGDRATRAGAAFANSKLMHATNQSDSYRMLIHPGPCIIPAALATAELGGQSGKELLTALVAGYEVEARIAGDFIPTTQSRGFRSSPVYGTLGAAVATGKLIGLDEDQLVTALALALACTFAGGTTEGPRSGGREMMFHEPQRHPQRGHGRSARQGKPSGIRDGAGGRGGILSCFHRQQSGQVDLHLHWAASDISGRSDR